MALGNALGWIIITLSWVWFHSCIATYCLHHAPGYDPLRTKRKGEKTYRAADHKTA